MLFSQHTLEFRYVGNALAVTIRQWLTSRRRVFQLHPLRELGQPLRPPSIAY